MWVKVPLLRLLLTFPCPYDGIKEKWLGKDMGDGVVCVSYPLAAGCSCFSVDWLIDGGLWLVGCVAVLPAKDQQCPSCMFPVFVCFSVILKLVHLFSVKLRVQMELDSERHQWLSDFHGGGCFDFNFLYFFGTNPMSLPGLCCWMLPWRRCTV